MSRRNKKRLVNRSIGIDLKMLEWYEEESYNRDMSVSELMRLALKEFKNREQQVKDFKDKGAVRPSDDETPSRLPLDS